jgi:hypothetical protein
MPSEWIAVLVAGRGTTETKRLLVEGIEIVVRQGAGLSAETPAPGVPETWRRVTVAPGIELHLRR